VLIPSVGERVHTVRHSWYHSFRLLNKQKSFHYFPADVINTADDEAEVNIVIERQIHFPSYDVFNVSVWY